MVLTTNSLLPKINPTSLDSWSNLRNHAQDLKTKHLRDYFDQNPCRHEQMCFTAAGLTIDISRQPIEAKTFDLLLSLSKDCEFDSARRALFACHPINFTEDRPVLHTQQRQPIDQDSTPESVINNRKHIEAIVKQVHTQQWLGYSGQAIKDVVNIGIGGSDLGPQMACKALKGYQNPNINLHFVSNMDPSDLTQTLAGLNPDTTLFVVSSKSWSTLETLSNAEVAKSWLLNSTHDLLSIERHFIAISSKPDKCAAFGIAANNILPMLDGVGGRFSMWSAIGLPIALATSYEHFEALLAGAHAMDKHFQHADLANNVPLLLALVDIWQVNFFARKTVACLPYSHDLRLLPDHLQQLIMESNGKQIDRSGNVIDYMTSPVIWGAAGTNGQHSFHQLLHQGTEVIPAEFVLPINGHGNNTTQQHQLISNCLAQAQALMDGVDEANIKEQLLADGLSDAQASQLAKHKRIPGNRPSTIITMESLTPASLGALIALYEHKVFCQSIIWNINAFDQWGVELGKNISTDIYQALSHTITKGAAESMDNPATQASLGLIAKTIK